MENIKQFQWYLNYCKMTKQNKNKIETLKNYLQLVNDLKEFEKITI